MQAGNLILDVETGTIYRGIATILEDGNVEWDRGESVGSARSGRDECLPHEQSAFDFLAEHWINEYQEETYDQIGEDRYHYNLMIKS